jgi:26S proteasome regulatory subunit N10
MQLHRTQPHGLCNFLAGMRVAALALKHRQNRNQRMRIVVFVGSPLGEDVTQQEVCE